MTIFTTGGTIDKTYFDAKSTYQVDDPQILTILDEANVTARYRQETLFRKDSLELTDADRAEIARRVQDDDDARILITHGTDTMVQTAQAIQDAGAPGKTIVLVGSLSPARFKASDAAFNVGFALGALQVLPPGVYVTMNGHIFRPDEVRKDRDRNQFVAL
ncbi:MAG: asparaginase domain-containing protein [Rhodothermales bacterium]